VDRLRDLALTMALYDKDTPQQMRDRERAAARAAHERMTPGQKKRFNFIGCLLFLVVAGTIGALVVFFINNPNGIPR
jgi:hypothetical protein